MFPNADFQWFAWYGHSEQKKVSPSLVSFSCDGGGWAKSDVDDNDNETSPSFKFVVVSGGGSVDKTSFRFLSS